MTLPFKMPAALAVLVLLTACNEVAYVRHANQRAITTGDTDNGFARQVDYHLSRAFFETPPACIMVAPPRLKQIAPAMAQTIAEAAARHLSARVDRVINTRRVIGEARKRVFDPGNADDRRRLARSLRCDAIAEITDADMDSTFAVVWTDISVDIALRVVRARDAEVLWRGRHRARRGDGGLPLTLAGIGAGTFAAGKLAGDTDALPSMIDDTLRRMMASLPDVRKF